MLESILTFLGGSATMKVLELIFSKRKQKTDEFQILLNEYKEDNEKLRIRLDNLEGENILLKQQVNILSNQLIIIEAQRTNSEIEELLNQKRDSKD